MVVPPPPPLPLWLVAVAVGRVPSLLSKGYFIALQ